MERSQNSLFPPRAGFFNYTEVSVNIEAVRADLARYIQSKAKVINAESGYILIKEVNHAVSPYVLRTAAMVIKELFLHHLPSYLYPDIVIGIPNRGKELATTLGIQNNLTIGVTERIENDNKDHWEPKVEYNSAEDMVKIYDIPSFTKPGKLFTHKIRGLRPGMKVLVADDFCATGTVTHRYREALAQLDITPIFVYIVAKDFAWLDPPQIGYRFNKQKGAHGFAVVILTNIIGDTGGEVIATSEDINF